MQEFEDSGTFPYCIGSKELSSSFFGGASFREEGDGCLDWRGGMVLFFALPRSWLIGRGCCFSVRACSIYWRYQIRQIRIISDIADLADRYLLLSVMGSASLVSLI